MKRKIKNIIKITKNRNKGITLIALSITIIILLILAGISVGMLTGDNSIINKAGNAKMQTEIAEEKEIVNKSVVYAMGKNRMGNLEEKIFQESINSNAGENRAKVYADQNDFIVIFKTGRAYTVNKDGEITDVNTEFKTAERKLYNQLEDINIGNEEAIPYEINCIEDLLDLSIAVNGIKIENEKINYISQYNEFDGKYVRVNRNLNFKSELSYENSERTDYGDINRDGITETLMKELTTGKGWLSIGGQGETKNLAGFSGTFFGKDDVKEIKNLNINDTETTTPKGLFGVISDSTIKDISVNSNIYCSFGNIGGIAGKTRTSSKIEISNCSYSGNIENSSTNADVGGIIGSIENVTTAHINNCNNYGKIKGNSDGTGVTRGTGGIIGYRNGGTTCDIINCHNYSKVEGNKKTGGIIGAGNAVKIYNCSNEGTIQGISAIGGIVGYNPSYIEKSYNKATITSTETGAGGIVGMLYSGKEKKIYQCYNDKDATVTGTSDVGGIIGKITASTYTKVEQCYNLAQISGTGGTSGIVGNISGNYTRIINCYNKGNVIGTDICGIANGSNGALERVIITSCYNTGTLTASNKMGITKKGILKNIYYLSTCGATDTKATSKSESELKALTSELDKAFTIDDTENTITVLDDKTQGVWVTDDSNKNEGYPILSWQ